MSFTRCCPRALQKSECWASALRDPLRFLLVRTLRQVVLRSCSRPTLARPPHSQEGAGFSADWLNLCFSLCLCLCLLLLVVLLVLVLVFVGVGIRVRVVDGVVVSVVVGLVVGVGAAQAAATAAAAVRLVVVAGSRRRRSSIQ